jgi:hypothetical protein
MTVSLLVDNTFGTIREMDIQNICRMQINESRSVVSMNM